MQGDDQKNDLRNIVLKVYLHCEECAKPIVKCLNAFEGVEEIIMDFKEHKIIVKGTIDVDPERLAARLVKKCNKQVEIISPKRIVWKKPSEPKIVKVIISIYIHCENCGESIKRNIGKMSGVQKVEVDAMKSQATVKGEFDPQELVKYIHKIMGKQAIIMEIVHQRKHQCCCPNNNNDNINRLCQEINPLKELPPQDIHSLCLCNMFSDDNTQACIIA